MDVAMILIRWCVGGRSLLWKKFTNYSTLNGYIKWIYLTAGQRWIIDGQSQLWQWGGFVMGISTGLAGATPWRQAYITD
jgi:hypothetical protein